jgi:chemotaxis protein CheD
LCVLPFQPLFSINTLGVNLAKFPQNSASSPEATKTDIAPQLSPFMGFQNHAAPAVEEVRVNMAEMKVEDRPVALVTNVGSCVAVCIHDSINRCGGLAHIMLPSSSVTRNKSFPLKYADTAIPALTEALRKLGKGSVVLSAKMVGGANMFPNMKFITLNIGEKNVEAVRQVLAAEGVMLLAEDVGGNCGRRVSFNVVDGSVSIRNVRREFKII